ncbi:hypothetical protein CLOM_g21992 [Closterium sp. NIES-68]|nr:hypothetical protein CLOM_g21992 [Closterium sp. NIES-68]GJP68948.1 hypothetical protein CLOP_g25584 [Closterium sp. NIES-67]GJP72239.1 hypothetical protein CLOP_g2987 [Closterium sp. NIES-67]
MSAPSLASFVPVPPGSHFPIQNLPFGVFRSSPGGSARVGVAIGEQVLDLSVVADAGLLGDVGDVVKDTGCFHQSSLNTFMALGRPVWQRTRAALQRLLSADEPTLRDNKALRTNALHHQSHVLMELPAVIGDYTDFYASKHHATNVGRLFRGKGNELPAQWLYMPIAYHGRSSSVVVSGTPIERPRGQLGLPPSSPSSSFASLSPLFGPSQQLDFELEMAVLIGPGNERGESIPVERALDCCFGMVLCNDWSARDIQRWEYVPLGPFLGKNFATTISPWVVTMDALQPCVCSPPPQDPVPLPYLRDPSPRTFDIRLQVFIAPSAPASAASVPAAETPTTAPPNPPVLPPPTPPCPHALLSPDAVDSSPPASGEASLSHRLPPVPVCSSNFNHLYWTISQQVAHHSINGCPLRPGDLLASGTISGPSEGSEGCMLERTQGGRLTLELSPDGCRVSDGSSQASDRASGSGAMRRTYLEDGDEVIMTASCQLPCGVTIGFGDCRGVVLPSGHSTTPGSSKQDGVAVQTPRDASAP